jgi:hypothetical protein
MMMPPPGIMVVHPSGAPIGSADTIASHEGDLSPDAPDPGDHSSVEAAHMDDGHGGGDFGEAGDFGGGDFGGGDFGDI